jgi:hypothetical protein
MRQSLKPALGSLMWILSFACLPASAQSVPAIMIASDGFDAPTGLDEAYWFPDHSQGMARHLVFKFNGLTYYTYGFPDRLSLAIVAFDDNGKVIKLWEKGGINWYSGIVVNEADRTVAFKNSSQTVTLSWSELANLAPNGSWKLGKVTNNTDKHVMFSFHVPKNGSVGADSLNQLAMVGILIDNYGILSIDPQGNSSGCSNPAWRTEIQFGSTIWEFYYNTGTTLDITLNPNQQFVFTPGPDAQILPQGQPASCR